MRWEPVALDETLTEVDLTADTTGVLTDRGSLTSLIRSVQAVMSKKMLMTLMILDMYFIR